MERRCNLTRGEQKGLESFFININKHVRTILRLARTQFERLFEELKILSPFFMDNHITMGCDKVIWWKIYVTMVEKLCSVYMISMQLMKLKL